MYTNTRPDTIFGATYMVISPEHPMLRKYEAKIKNSDAIKAYREAAAKKSDFERSELNKEKTGVIKSAVGIGALLAEGIGDTIRISLTGDPGVDPKILDPRDTYADASVWESKAKDLASRFQKNFVKYEDNEKGKALVAAGPKLD